MDRIFEISLNVATLVVVRSVELSSEIQTALTRASVVTQVESYKRFFC